MTYVVYWYHTSVVSIKGNKAKFKTFSSEEKAEKFADKLSELEIKKQTYKQGYVSLVATNFNL